MDLNYLYYFKILAETENYTRAAGLLHVTQPSLSYAISRLERELGNRLFDKSGRNVVLNEYGKLYYTYVTNALGQLEAGREALKRKSEESELIMGITKTMVYAGLPHRMIQSYESQFLEMTGKIRTKLYAQSADIYAGIRSGEIDLGICLPSAEQEFSSFPVFQRDLCVFTGEDHPLAEKEIVSCRELLDYRLVLYKNSKIAGYLSGLASRERKTMEAEYFDEFVDNVYVAMQNHAAAIAPMDQRIDYYGCHACRIVDYPYDMSFYMVIRAGHQSEDPAERFFRYCRKRYFRSKTEGSGINIKVDNL